MDIKIQKVSMTYPNGKQALKDLSLDLRAPSLVGLLGPNGAGKSTLMKLLVAALMPTSGTIKVDGQPLAKSDKQLKSQLGSDVLDLCNAQTQDQGEQSAHGDKVLKHGFGG